MSNLREAAQQALEELDAMDSKYIIGGGLWREQRLRVITALRTALEQPEQEPVAWEHHEYRPYGAPGEIRIHAILASQYMMPDGSVVGDYQWLVDQYKADKNTIKLFPLYTAPPAAQRPWVELTDDQTKDCIKAWDGNDAYALCRAIEAKLKEKNT